MSVYLKTSQRVQALADPTRLELLNLVLSEEACASDLHLALGMSQPRVARHLKILVEAGFLAARRDGRFVRYSLSRDSTGARLVRAALGLVPAPSEASNPAAAPTRHVAGPGSAGRASGNPPPSPPRPAEASTPIDERAPEAVDDTPRSRLEDFLL